MKEVKNKKKKNNNIINKIKNNIFNKDNIYKIIIILPFILLDLITRIRLNINYVNIIYIPNILFNLLYSILFIKLIYTTKYNKLIYNILSIISLILFMLFNIYYGITNEIFDFNLLTLASESKNYLLETLLNANKLIYIIVLIYIIITILINKYIINKIKTKTNIIKLIIIFIILHSLIPLSYGLPLKYQAWDMWNNKSYIYTNFNDNYKSYSITNIYEYTIRNIYKTYIKNNNIKITKEEQEYLDNIINNININNNEYTGLLKNKNIIMIQMEGIDSWLLNEDKMPNLYNLYNNSIKFTNHYSFYNGGGATINTDFIVNTGYTAPKTFVKSVYSFNKNTMPYTLANILKNYGYKNINAFHMNTGEFYSRRINYKSWGYDNYNSLVDDYNYKDNKYELDRELILNEDFSNKMFSNELFMDYIITYTTHMAFDENKEMCKYLKEDKNINKKLNEEDCVYLQASETDYFIKLLIDKLKEKNLYDNTIIVGFTDHYLYTLQDKTIIQKYKNTNNLINNTPFFIWTSDIEKQEINKVSSQIDILPTILNLIGFKYNKNIYPGNDILDPNTIGITYFNDLSYYDGKNYVDENTKENDLIRSQKEYINNTIKKNDLILKSDYFKGKEVNY